MEIRLKSNARVLVDGRHQSLKAGVQKVDKSIGKELVEAGLAAELKTASTPKAAPAKKAKAKKTAGKKE